jgi:hypothetical protein
MRVAHKLSVSPSEAIAADLARHGIKYSKSSLTISFTVHEDSPKWPEMRDWAKRHGAFDWVTTEFSTAELDGAKWLEMIPAWHYGFPLPDSDNFGYRQTTYDPSEGCSECGICGRQVAPFQIKGEPKWGRNSILQLNWVFDEFFVTPELWSRVFQPLGVTSLPVKTQRGDELRTVVQLKITEDVDVAVDGLDFEVCGSCASVKYLPITTGPFPAITSADASIAAKSRQWFGSGGSAYRPVLVEQTVRRLILDRGAKGASFRPVGPLVSQ